jgi:hypothetical protein
MQDLNTLTVKALKLIAKDAGMRGYSKLRKADLITAIEAHRRQAMAKTLINVKGYVAKIRQDGTKQIIAKYNTTCSGYVTSPNFHFGLADAKNGEIFECFAQTNNDAPVSECWQIQNGSVVSVAHP